MVHTYKKRFLKIIISFIFAILFACCPFISTVQVNAQTLIPKSSLDMPNYAGKVNPFIGTTNSGDTFPGADAPFGMVQWSPDTVNDYAGGYDYSDNRIKGFSLTHLSGAGCNAYGDIPFMPYTGTVTASPASNPSEYVSTFSHSNETASAGYYKVGLDNGVTTELTTTERTGAARFTYPANQTATLLLNASGSIQGDSNTQVNISGNTLSGSATSSGFCVGTVPYTIYFYATFNQPFTSSGTWKNGTVSPGSASASGSGAGAYVTFNTTTIDASVGISYVSVANAQANLNQEDPSGDFATVLSKSTQTWNSYLSEIQVSGGTADQSTIFYTALYHSLLFPSVFSDDNGQYIGFDSKIYTEPSGHTQYANYSNWDIYRSEAQLIGLLAPGQAADMAQSLVNDYAQSGQLPKWTLGTIETYTMVGDSSDAIIADFYAFGGTGFDTQSALNAMVAEATQTNNVRPGLSYLENNGYIPSDGTAGCCNFNGPASTSLEYNTDDFSIAAFAQALGNTSDYDQFVNRAQDWKNLLNPSNQYLEPRTLSGSFPSQYDPTSSDNWVEGDGAQYNWMVPFNLAGLFSAEGGNSAIVPRLNNFFTQLNAGQNSSYAWMGNEPSIEVPWEYDYAGAPYQTQNVVRQIENSLYTNTTGGLAGNDDLGEMSSWYVFAALGMFPETPGTANLVLTSPLFPSITLTRPGGQTIQINAPGASASTYYIQGLNVNGTATAQPWLAPSFITSNQTLDYTLSTNANTSWGADPSDAPPSYGSVSSGTTNGTFLTGFESGDPQPTWVDTADLSGSPAGGLANVGPVCCGLSGPQVGIRQETAHNGNLALMYSGAAQGASSDYAYMKLFDLSSQNVTVGSSTTLSYWIYPQSSSTNSLVSGGNSSCVAIDLIFSDNTNLRDSGALDQHGNRAHPAYQCGHLTLDSWNHVTVNLGSYVNGKTVVRIDLGYDQPGSSGGYRGYIDDLSIS